MEEQQKSQKLFMLLENHKSKSFEEFLLMEASHRPLSWSECQEQEHLFQGNSASRIQGSQQV